VEFFRKIFGGKSSNASAIEAKNRLMTVLIHDRTDISPALLENLRMEMIALLKKYMDIDESNIDINLNRDGAEVELVANVPVRSVKRETNRFSENSSMEKNLPRENRAARAEPGRNYNKHRRHR